MIKADVSRQKGVEGDRWTAPPNAGRAVAEYLAVLDDAAFAVATSVVPKYISPTDPAARWTGADGGLAYFIGLGLYAARPWRFPRAGP